MEKKVRIIFLPLLLRLILKKEVDMKILLKEYRHQVPDVDSRLRDQLIMDYAPLVRFVAQRISARLPSNIIIDDLISAGVIGLMDAIEKYDPTRDNKFKHMLSLGYVGQFLMS